MKVFTFAICVEKLSQAVTCALFAKILDSARNVIRKMNIHIRWIEPDQINLEVFFFS